MNWKIQSEEKQALDLLARWQAMDVEDALELLSPQYTHHIVRKYAVSRLNQASDEVFMNVYPIIFPNIKSELLYLCIYFMLLFFY